MNRPPSIFAAITTSAIAVARAATSLVSLAAVLALPACDAPKRASTNAAPSSSVTSNVMASGQASVTATDSASTSAGSGVLFGAKLSDATPFVALADIYRDPQAYAGRRVRTRGEVVAVCQAAGCWCDLRPEGNPNDAAVPTHVMMHDHAFLLPKTAKSKLADLEGTLVVKALSQSEVDHYNAEGASLVAGTSMINVDAVGVVLR